MRVVGACRFPVDSLSWRTTADAWMLTVVCKITLELRPDRSFPARDQLPIYRTDHHHGGVPTSSLAAANDLVPRKPCGEVLLVGNAFAPRGEPRDELETRLTVARPGPHGLDRLVDKGVRVRASGVRRPDGGLHNVPALKMALRYEHAPFEAARNPVGVRPDNVAGLLPTVLGVTEGHTDGYGPLSLHWPARGGRLANHEGDISTDVIIRECRGDMRLFCAAPLEQRTEMLTGEEAIILENLHPIHPVLGTRLSCPRPTMWVERPLQPRVEVPMRCDTIFIDTDRGLCALTWRGLCALEQEREEGQITVACPGTDTTIGGASTSQGTGARAWSRTAAFAPAPVAAPQIGAPVAEVVGAQRLSPWAVPEPRAASDEPYELPPLKALTLTEEQAHSVRLAQRRSFQLLWFHDTAARRVRALPWYGELYDGLEEEARDGELDALAPSDATADVDDHRELFQAITRGPLVTDVDVATLLHEAIRDDGKLVAPAVILEGQLVFALDETRRLRATIDVVVATVDGSEVETACAPAERLMRLAHVPPSLAAARRAELERRFGKEASRALASSLVDESLAIVARDRAFCTVPVLGRPHLACRFTMTNATGPTPAYLCASVLDRLPLSDTLDVRIVADVHPLQDPTERDPYCLRVLALARIVYL